ncbi:MAG: PLP-dependent aspartate aminotransferase family protein [Gemmatimonadaceae bacterium]
MHIETLAVHAGHEVDPYTAAVTPAIHLSTTFEREADGTFRKGYIYARDANPNRDALERCLAELEGGKIAAAFSSGSGATLAALQALSPGAHVVAPDDAYYGTRRLLRDLLGRWGLEASFVDMTDCDAVERAVRPGATRLVWVETPSNPLVRVVDIRRVAEIAHATGAVCACDNTWATPVITRPLELGADLVMHSTTKYLGGHSDVVSGALVARENDDFFRRVRAMQTGGGIIPSPFDCWLVLRGIRTLPWRMRAHSSNAERVARFLASHRNVRAVHYPGLETHPGHAVAKRQMSLPGGMLSVEVRGGRAEAMSMTGRLRIFTRATSLGGTESLIEHRASVEGAETRAPEGLLRISVGLENAEDLIEDLEQALDY